MPELKLQHARDPERMTKVGLKLTLTSSGWVGEGWFQEDAQGPTVLPPTVSQDKQEALTKLVDPVMAVIRRGLRLHILGYQQSCQSLEAVNRLLRGIQRGRSEMLDRILRARKQEALLQKRACWSRLKWNNRVAAAIEGWNKDPE